MHESELRRLVDCVCCGATLSVARDRAYSLAHDRVLCFECSVRRGGRFDEERDDWSSPPDTLDLQINVEG